MLVNYFVRYPRGIHKEIKLKYRGKPRVFNLDSRVKIIAVALIMKRLVEYFVGIACFTIFLLACNESDKLEAEISSISIDFEVNRFDQEFAAALPSDISKLKKKYPFLFPQQYSDSIWEAKLTDTLQVALQQATDSVFNDFDKTSTELEVLFKHIKYYFPKYQEPKVVTLISGVDYHNRIVLSDTLLLIGLDNYLGSDHEFYAGMANYIAKGLDRSFLVSDVTGAFAKKVNPYPRNRAFLSRMVHYGKELYLKDKLMPTASDGQKIGYTEEEIHWAQENEEQIWRYFIENELLYNTDSKLDRSFLDPAPFSKFGLELDSESPGRLGRYIGWQIVRAFAEKNDKVELIQLLDLPADELFKKSNYKPKR